MKILYVASTNLSGETGSPGSVRHVMEVAENLQARGHEVIVLVPGVGRYPHPATVRIVYVPCIRRRYLRTLVHEALVPFWLARFLPWADAVYWRQALLSPWPPLLARIFGKPLVAEVNGLTADEVNTEAITSLRRRVILALERMNYGLARRLVCVAPRIAERIREHYGLAEEKVRVVLNGVNANRMPLMDARQARAGIGLPPDAPVVGFVGHFFPWDGIETLIAAAPAVLARFPETRFVVVGSGPWGGHLPELARTTGVGEAFVFTGRVPWERLYLYLNAFDIATAPYSSAINQESGRSSLKLLEYFALAKPVVASETDVIPEVRDLETRGLGVLVTPEEPGDLARALNELLADPEKRARLGQGGREYVLSERGWDKVAQQVEAVILEAAGQGEGR
ncbi:MAG: glycosyltransferase family 4 protein [Pseudomonadota bacterium]